MPQCLVPYPPSPPTPYTPPTDILCVCKGTETFEVQDRKDARVGVYVCVCVWWGCAIVMVEKGPEYRVCTLFFVFVSSLKISPPDPDPDHFRNTAPDLFHRIVSEPDPNQVDRYACMVHPTHNTPYTHTNYPHPPVLSILILLLSI